MYRRILLAIDGGACAATVLAQAIELARASGAEMRLLHVADDSDVFFEGSDGAQATAPHSANAHGLRLLGEAAARCAEAGVAHTTRLLERPDSTGQVAAAIAAEAEACNADLVVLGTHGRRSLGERMLGSVAHSVLTKTSRPVLLVRAD
ncbi:hypothetical protein BKK81_22270 [Cupriavidus sp. USMAHM13]|uniref:universal stress protein n=1 Tax=Cupriavidus sp. USMAHM13 TaxID=1389192 RepID=UPI0008A68146|nr:universal stress protein [Cupriavidus sp. USMAHM13]AOZ02059.1 hypothetical protein BKK81_22270 [Cupriavidus sp. USMAHM13]